MLSWCQMNIIPQANMQSSEKFFGENHANFITHFDQFQRFHRAPPVDCDTITMLQTAKLIPQGQGLASVLLKRATRIELDWDVRQKSRFDATDSAGRALGIFLPRGTLVRGGDVLIAEDGSLIKVIAAPQPVLVITACATHGSSTLALASASASGAAADGNPCVVSADGGKVLFTSSSNTIGDGATRGSVPPRPA